MRCARKTATWAPTSPRKWAAPIAFVILEIWKDQAAFDAHGKSAATTAFGDKFKELQNAPLDVRVHNGMAVVEHLPAAGTDALVVASHVDVPPPRKDELVTALNPLAVDSRKVPGNQFASRCGSKMNRPNHFTVVEAWRGQQGLRCAWISRAAARVPG